MKEITHDSACEKTERSLYEAPKEIHTENTPKFSWSSMMIHDNQMLGPSMDTMRQSSRSLVSPNNKKVDLKASIEESPAMNVLGAAPGGPPDTDPLGLPVGVTMNTVTPEQMISHYQGMIHQAMDFLPSDQIQQIIKSNPAAVNERGFNGIVPLHKAALRGDPKLVELMVRHGANPNDANSFDETPLHFAAKVGSPVIMHKMIEAGADIHVKDRNGRGVLHLAAQSGSVPALLYLQDVHGLSANVGDNNDITPLHLVCAHGHLDALHYLLKKERCEFRARDAHGNTCLHIASQYCMMEVMWQLMVRGGYSFLREKNGEGFTALDLCQHSSSARRKEASKLLELYMAQAESGRLTGPTPVWIALLLFPMGSWWLLICLAQLLTDSGWLVLGGVVVICYFIYTQTHRMNHICRWPNPIHAGMFAAGILSTDIVYICEMWTVLQPQMPNFAVFSVIAICFHLYLYYRILIKDPGVVTDPVVRISTGIPITIRQIASGEVPLDALCPACEIVPPIRTHHCRLCRHCYADCDHHCLFLYRCVAKNTHRLFVLFIAYTAIAMLVFSYLATRYFSAVYTQYDYIGDVMVEAFHKSPAAYFLCLANFVSGLWLLNLVRYQLVVVGRNHTTAYQPNRGRTSLSRAQQTKNILHFLMGRPPFAEDSNILQR